MIGQETQMIESQQLDTLLLWEMEEQETKGCKTVKWWGRISLNQKWIDIDIVAEETYDRVRS